MLCSKKEKCNENTKLLHFLLKSIIYKENIIIQVENNLIVEYQISSSLELNMHYNIFFMQHACRAPCMHLYRHACMHMQCMDALVYMQKSACNLKTVQQEETNDIKFCNQVLIYFFV